ncbi:MAG: hypothetical protein EBZ49_18775 [Proteobacteria bacterium]|nr:hypothetical protein [Pseudomonadota bacterium]
MKPRYLHTLLEKKVVFFTGKGGVGKSALTSATAVLCQRQGKKVFLVSWNPFDTHARSFPYSSLGIEHLVLDGPSCFKEYVLGILKFEKIYDLIFENNVFQTFIAASPGLAETVIAGKIWDLMDKNPQALILVDLPASGHAFTFFSSPLGLRKLFRMGLVHREIERICEMFLSSSTLLNFVTLPEELPLSETLEFKNKLAKLGKINMGFFLLNQCLPQLPGREPVEPLNNDDQLLLQQYRSYLDQELRAEELLQSAELPQIKLPRLSCPEWITTVEALSRELERQ